MTKEEERFISGALLKMCDDLVGKLKERDTTLTLTYEVDNTKEDEIEDEPNLVATDEPETFNMYRKLDVLRVIYNNSYVSKNVDEVLEDAEKVYKWVNK